MSLIRKGSIVLLAILISSLNTVSAYAMTEGTYIVPLIVSYANPQTGVIVDGGSNEALGTSMCQSVMQADALVEQNTDTAYVTLGIGLASNISSREILLQQEAGQDVYEYTDLVETGSCTRDNDTCIHYRFEMNNLDMLISPVLFVDPMGREVQFFVQLDTAKAVEGTGNYLSEMRTLEVSEDEAVMALEEVQAEEVEVAEGIATPEITEEPGATLYPTVTEEVESVEEVEEPEVLDERSNISKIVIGTVIAIIVVASIYIKRKLRGRKSGEKED